MGKITMKMKQDILKGKADSLGEGSNVFIVPVTIKLEDQPIGSFETVADVAWEDIAKAVEDGKMLYCDVTLIMPGTGAKMKQQLYNYNLMYGANNSVLCDVSFFNTSHMKTSSGVKHTFIDCWITCSIPAENGKPFAVLTLEAPV